MSFNDTEILKKKEVKHTTRLHRLDKPLSKSEK